MDENPPIPGKKCYRCGELKTSSEFRRCAKNKDGLASNCKTCMDKYDREYWDKTKEHRNVSKRSNSEAIRQRNRQFVWDFLREHACIDCGESDPIVLEFYHKDPKEKKSNVSEMIGQCSSLRAIGLEIAKCDVRCANCHRRKTSRQFGWYTNWV